MANVNKNAVVLEALKFAREKCETAAEVATFISSIAKLYDTSNTNTNNTDESDVSKPVSRPADK